MNRKYELKRAAILATLIGSGALAIVACSSSDGAKAGPPQTDGGGGSAGSGAGGTAGKGGAGGSVGGKGGTAGGGSGGMDASTADSGGPDAGDSGSALAPLSGTLFVAGADYGANAGELAAFDLATGSVLGHVDVADGDLGLAVNGGIAFLLERKGGAVDVLGPTGAIAKHIPLDTGDSGATALNPHSPLVVSATQAYVPLYDGNAIAVIDPTAGTQTGLISLGSLLDAQDGDGSTNPDSVHYDAANHRAYFTLGQTDIYSGTAASNYMPVCPNGPSLIVAVDTTTNTLVDLPGTGMGYALPQVAPGSTLVEPTTGHAYVVSDGCNGSPDGGALRTKHGVASIDLATGTTEILYAPASQDFLGGIFAAGSKTFLETDDENYQAFYHRFTTTPGAPLGAALTNVPGAPVVASASTLLGYDFAATADGGSSTVVKRYEIETERATELVTVPFSGSYFVLSLAVKP